VCVWFFIMWMCVCMCFVVCGCVCVCMGFIICGNFDKCVCVLLICVLEFTVICIVSFMYILSFLFCLY